MDYQTFQPHPDLASLVKCYWTLEVPAATDPQKQLIIPDGCIEMAFILGDDIKRYLSEDEFVLQPRAMVLGQRKKSFYIEPAGYVNSFAVNFYPYGFANLTTMPIKDLAEKETPLRLIFGEAVAIEIEQKILAAADTQERIGLIESFLTDQLKEGLAIDHVVKTTIDTLLSSNGRTPIIEIFKQDLAKRRQLERMFAKQIGISPKQLGRVIRLQTALKMLLNTDGETLTRIAYDSDYYDQAHFIKDFKAFTGMNPSEFLGNEQMALSSLFHK